MEQKQDSYKSMKVRFYQDDLDCVLSGSMTSHGWEFDVFNHVQNKHIFEGDLRDTIELILLGKLMKDKMVNSKVTIEEKAKATQIEEPIAVIEEV